MKCSDIERFAEAYLDDEFDARDRAEIDAHLGACDTCRDRIEMERGFRQYVRESVGEERAPSHLMNNILLALDSADDGNTPQQLPSSAPETTPDEPNGWQSWRGWRYVSIGAAAAVLLAMTIAGVSVEPGKNGTQLTGHLGNVIAEADNLESEEEVVEETLDWHRRRLPMEVTGPHGEDVRTWFRGKVDFPVRVPHFRNANVSLLGGRLAKVGDHKAALLTMEVDHRKLSMMAFPISKRTHRIRIPQRDEPPLIMRNASGYNVAIIRDGDIAYSFVSDLPQRQLRHLLGRVNLR